MSQTSVSISLYHAARKGPFITIEMKSKIVIEDLQQDSSIFPSLRLAFMF